MTKILRFLYSIGVNSYYHNRLEMEDVLLREVQGNNNNQLLEEFVVVSVGVVISNNDKVAPALPGGH